MDGKSRYWWLSSSLLLALLAFGALGCAPGSQPGPAATGGQRAASSAPEAAQPSAAWQQVVAAAKQEGKIVISGPPTAESREALTQGFERRYPEIQVEYVSQAGSQVPPKLIAERQAGQYLVDLVINGTTTQIDLIKGNIMDPIVDYLVGPEARDTAKWTNGKFDFADDAGKYNLVFAVYVKTPIAYHARSVSPGELTSYRDLLNPKWKGKIALYDPRGAGAGLATVTFHYAAEGLGKEYLQQLFAQDVVLSRDDRQILDWVVRGQYAIALSPSEKVATELRSKGVNVEMLEPEALKEGSYLTAGVGAVGVVNQAPHRNAVKVYLDYLLSYEAQLAFSKGVGIVSRRADVPTDDLPGFLVPKLGVQYQENYKEPYVEMKQEILEFLRTAIR